MESSIGSYEAKTHLPQLLERVAKGERITIMKRGVPMAVLVPPESVKPQTTPKDAVQAMKRFQKESAPTLGPGITIREMIEEGRRF
ncbi:MAG: prevent-host-death protein [Planctomycetes bacterium SCN 63-9]|nr:MAG: prevent-host-death protein [Planctomycetes bacterium SCN 63-9]